jgi:hypothetical protein
VVIGGLLWFAWSWRVELRQEPMRTINVDTLIVPGLARWRARADRSTPTSTVVFGDSLLTCASNLDMTKSIALGLAAAGAPTSIVRVGHIAFRPIHLVYLLDDILEGGPNLVIVEINLRLLGEARGFGGLRFLNLSRRLSWSRAFRIRAALAAEGLTLLDPPIYRHEDSLDALYLADGVQAVGRHLLDDWGDTVNAALHLRNVAPLWRGFGMRRFGAKRARLEYGGDPEHNQVAVALREALHAFHRAHVPALLYVSPINMGALEKVGVARELAFERRIESLRSAIGAADGEWLDLHAAVPDSGFRDNANHLNDAGCEPTARAIVERLRERMR